MKQNEKNLRGIEVKSVEGITGDLEGHGLVIGIVVARFNLSITSKLLQGAQEALEKNNVLSKDITVVNVPGSFELPIAAKRLGTNLKPNAIICLGAIIHHETDHDKYLGQAVSQSLASLALELTTPIIFGVLTTDTQEQAVERSGGIHGNRGYEAALSAIEIATLIPKLGKEKNG